jgi:membrane protein DedA with SNARE-associated domain
VANAAELIYSLFSSFGYSAILLGVMLDNAEFPVPGELILLITGSLVAHGDFSIVPAVITAASGAVLSDTGWYFAGRLGSKRLMHLYCRVSFGSTACVARTERNLARFGPRSLIYARFIPGFRTFAAPVAGISGVPYRRFALYDGIGALLWAAFGIGAGSVFAREFTLLADRFRDVELIFAYLAATGLCLFILVKWLVRRRHGRAEIVLETEDTADVPSREPV